MGFGFVTFLPILPIDVGGDLIHPDQSVTANPKQTSAKVSRKQVYCCYRGLTALQRAPDVDHLGGFPLKLSSCVSSVNRHLGLFRICCRSKHVKDTGEGTAQKIKKRMRSLEETPDTHRWMMFPHLLPLPSSASAGHNINVPLEAEEAVLTQILPQSNMKNPALQSTVVTNY